MKTKLFISTMNTKILTLLLCMISSAFSFATDLKIFEKDGKYGLINADNNKIVLKAKYDSISSFKDGYALVRKKDKYGLINDEGKEYLPCKFKKILLPWAKSSMYRNPLFWVSTNGSSYYLCSDESYYTKAWYNVIYGPDERWYGQNSNGEWMTGISEPNAVPSSAHFKNNKLLYKKFPNDYLLFNNELYSPDRKIIAKDIVAVDTLNINGNRFLTISQKESKKSMLIDLTSGIIWEKNKEGLDGFYQAHTSEISYNLGVFDENLFHVYVWIDEPEPLFIIKDIESGFSSVHTRSNTILPSLFTQIKLDENAGNINHEPLWKITLVSQQPISESDIEDFVKYISKAHQNFVVESQSPMGTSLFGNTGKELIHNNLTEVYTEDGLLRVKFDGEDQIMDMYGLMPFSKYDNVWKSEKGNLTLQDYVVSKGGKVGLYVEGQGEVVPPLYEGFMRQWGHIYVYKNDLVGLYDDNGNKILEPKYANIKIDSPYTDTNYYFVKTTSGSAMLLGNNGKVILPAGQIDNVDFLSGDDGKWCKVYKNGKMGIMNLKTQKIVIPCVYADDIIFGNGQWPNRKIGVYRTGAGGDTVDIWTMSGKKISSRFCPSNTPYLNKRWIENQLNSRYYYD